MQYGLLTDSKAVKTHIASAIKKGCEIKEFHTPDGEGTKQHKNDGIFLDCHLGPVLRSFRKSQADEEQQQGQAQRSGTCKTGQ